MGEIGRRFNPQALERHCGCAIRIPGKLGASVTHIRLVDPQERPFLAPLRGVYEIELGFPTPRSRPRLLNVLEP
jgi:hypothetical protein